MTSGRVIDIRTGRALARTSDLTLAFTNHVVHLLESDVEFYLVHGPCRHLEVRQMVTDLAESIEVPVLYDGKMKPDTVWIFEGEPEELGFAV